LVTSGLRIATNPNRPEIAASRRLIVVAAYWSIRRPDSLTAFGPGRPGTLASRQARKNRNNTSVVTRAVAGLQRQPPTERQQVIPVARTVFGE
jgi:hypothetical protein